MTKKFAHIAVFIALFILGAGSVALASTSGSADDRLNKFSLKNLSKYSKSYSLSGLRPSGLNFTGSQEIMTIQRMDNALQTNSIVRMEKGNTTFVYPYKYKVRVPKFKTPTSPSFR
ncbi:hypothetical protein HNQ91_005185 [Filimonas zeae]|uniref:Uncharacterized protein n=1 Tax=Filimonas zeae TaxID=1737353 RepID=A0A917MYR3_9BACT|nr:hypothetical protein [Filimonas zeae]MDR6342108.1 hypothetical protein [Filimonas zeae]GGH79078.1 hypothetical protein GCM10011379_47900 [Filimonas zeae]